MMLLKWNKLFYPDTLFQEGLIRESQHSHGGCEQADGGNVSWTRPEQSTVRSSNSRTGNWMLICAYFHEHISMNPDVTWSRASKNQDEVAGGRYDLWNWSSTWPAQRFLHYHANTKVGHVHAGDKHVREKRKVGVTQDAQNQLEVYMTHLCRCCLSKIPTKYQRASEDQNSRTQNSCHLPPGRRESLERERRHQDLHRQIAHEPANLPSLDPWLILSTPKLWIHSLWSLLSLSLPLSQRTSAS